MNERFWQATCSKFYYIYVYSLEQTQQINGDHISQAYSILTFLSAPQKIPKRLASLPNLSKIKLLSLSLVSATVPYPSAPAFIYPKVTTKVATKVATGRLCDLFKGNRTSNWWPR